MAGMRIATNCVGQYLVMGRVPQGFRSTLTRMGWGWAVSTRYDTRTRQIERGNFWTDDTAMAQRTAATLGIPFNATPQLREMRP